MKFYDKFMCKIPLYETIFWCYNIEKASHTHWRRNMKLLEYLKTNSDDKDFYDTVYDISVTISLDTESADDDAHHKFLVMLCDSVEIINENTVNWSGLIKNNMALFKDFMSKNWIIQYTDEDEFICEWITELHTDCAGMTVDSTYDEMLKLLKQCKYIEMEK